jgi:hypothetical protein
MLPALVISPIAPWSAEDGGVALKYDYMYLSVIKASLTYLLPLLTNKLQERFISETLQ